MHLYAMTRGNKYEMQQFIDSLHSNMMAYQGNDKTKMHKVQFVARPVQLWEMIFPKEYLANVLKGLAWPGHYRNDVALQFKALRLALGAKKIPKVEMTNVEPIFSSKGNIACYPIGIREDKHYPDDTDVTFDNGESAAGYEML